MDDLRATIPVEPTFAEGSRDTEVIAAEHAVGPQADAATGIAAIHAHCAVFTRGEVASAMLDFVDWRAERDLTEARLLEPACGEGAFLIPAVERLVASARSRDALNSNLLAGRIVAFEFDPTTAEVARRRVRERLEQLGLKPAMAADLAAAWVKCADFLEAEEIGVFTHVVGNPPYMRWSKLPQVLRKRYEAVLPVYAARGDLCLAFVCKATDLLAPKKGRVAFLCADRWLRCAYGAAARVALAQRVRVAAHLEVHDVPVFEGARKVSAYAAVTVLDQAHGEPGQVAKLDDLEALRRKLDAGPQERERMSAAGPVVLAGRGGAVLADTAVQPLFAALSRSTVPLGHAGVEIRCGMALGVAGAFLVAPSADVEPDRLLPFIRARDVGDHGDVEIVKRVVNVWSPTGALVDLEQFPRLKAHLQRHEAALRARVCVVRPEQWYRTIDRLNPNRLAAPKILVAGMAKRSRVGWHAGGAQPSNALYSLTSSQWPLRALYALLRSGVLDVFAAVLAPRFSGGSVRFDGNLLGQVRIPLWSSLDEGLRRELTAMGEEGELPAELISTVYGLEGHADRDALGAFLGRACAAVAP